MKLVTFQDSKGVRIGCQDSKGVIFDITKTNSSIPKEMKSFFQGGENTYRLAQDALKSKKNPINSSYSLLSPIYGCEKVLCVGMNYTDHCKEQGFPIPTEPIIFNKLSSSIIGTGEDIILNSETKELDYEVELAVVIGKNGKNIKREDAMSYVGGYTIVNDISARDWQMKKNGGQWFIGKTFDTFCPTGPCIVTSDELPKDLVHNLGVRCILNGEIMQDSNTKELIFDIDYLISWISRFVKLRCGDLILTGTPPGVGCFRKPPIWLKSGDVVTCEIDKIGRITNQIVEK
jgi:2-keto-4-pentenoate hydratase/2-oxohepta-3-ene-1,7-dioic acid hydratase in catechol pathway